MTATLAAPATTIDLRTIAPRERHALIFVRFDALRPGQAMELVNDHEPQPLHIQFEGRASGQFEWTYLEAGPELWRVRIGKNAVGPTPVAGNSCCSGGSCCG